MTITYLSGNRLQGLSTDTVETQTFSDDFTSYTTQGSANAVWIPVSGTNIRVDVTNDYILHTCTDGTSRQEICYCDLGSVSDTAWVLRFSKYTVTSGTSDTHIYISSVAGVDNIVTQGFAGCTNNGGGNLYWARTKDGVGSYNDGSMFVEANTNGNTLWFEIVRTSSSTMVLRRYSDSTYTTVSESSDISSGMSGITGLRYLTFCTNDDNNGETQSVFRYDNIKFYNGVTSVNSKPTNVPSGSRFEETDTRKIYYSSTVHTFLLAQTGTNFTPSASFNVEYLVVAGGGGGGIGGGGGAGGFRTGSGFPVTANQAYPITVGGGGSGSSSSSAVKPLGGSSIFSSITSTGGAGGGYPDYSGMAGGSGGGIGGNSAGSQTGGAGNTPSTSPSQGNNGGGSGGYAGVNYAGAGGGGSGAVGQNRLGNNIAGAGGNGTSSSITGSSVTYAGGGGGGSHVSGITVGAGGTGGGGSGSQEAAGIAGTDGLGGGGGGGNTGTVNGGSGIVIIKLTSGGSATGGTITTVWSERS